MAPKPISGLMLFIVSGGMQFYIKIVPVLADYADFSRFTQIKI